VASCAPSQSSGGAGPGGGKADGDEVPTPIAFVDDALLDRVEALQYAAANGKHRIGTYSVHDYDREEMRMAMVHNDRERHGCDERTYAETTAMSRTAAIAWLEEYDNGDEEQRRMLQDFIALLREEASVEILTSTHDAAGGDDPVACHYLEAVVLRDDGTAVWFEFNYAD
jgi:hypothetical protein